MHFGWVVYKKIKKIFQSVKMLTRNIFNGQDKDNEIKVFVRRWLSIACYFVVQLHRNDQILGLHVFLYAFTLLLLNSARMGFQ